MDLLTTFIIAISLAMDTFAVSLGVSTMNKTHNLRQIFRLSWHFGIFQGLMTFIGWLAGSAIERWITGIDHWVIFAMLLWIGGKMIYAGFTPKVEEVPSDPSRGHSLIILSVATSLDALAVGISFAFMQINIALSCAIITVVTMIISGIGGFSGSLLGRKFGKRMEIIGGLVLVGIGIKVLLEHLF